MKVADALEVLRARIGIPAEQWVVSDADRLSDHLATELARPRYVWVPTRDTFGPPERAGGSGRALYTRSAGLELHLWTDTQADAEERITNVIRAWHAEANTSAQPIALNWHAASSVGRGTLVTLTMELRVPIAAVALRTVRPTTVEPDASDAVQGDGALDWGETT